MLALWQQYKYIDELIPRCSLTTPSKHGLAKQWTLQNNNHLLEMFDGIEFMCIRRNEAFQSNSRRIQEFANLEGFLTIANQCVKVHEDKKRALPFFSNSPTSGKRRFPTNEREHHSYRLCIRYDDAYVSDQGCHISN